MKKYDKINVKIANIIYLSEILNPKSIKKKALLYLCSKQIKIS